MAKRRYEMDMCRGPLAGKLLRFSLPLILSGILQLLFNAAMTYLSMFRTALAPSANTDQRSV